MALELVNFHAIPENTLDAGDDLIRLTEMRKNLSTLAETWNALAAAGAPAASADAIAARTADITNAYKALKDSKLKIVNLTGVETNKIVFLGGSRKKRQSKKRKNQRKHNNQ
jgi:hypothetical protein